MKRESERATCALNMHEETLRSCVCVCACLHGSGGGGGHSGNFHIPPENIPQHRRRVRRFMLTEPEHRLATLRLKQLHIIYRRSAQTSGASSAACGGGGGGGAEEKEREREEKVKETEKEKEKEE